MPHINLLPWREIQKKEREVRFGIITGIFLFFAGLIVLASHLYMNSLINYQKVRNNYLNQEIKLAESKIKKIETLEDKKQQMVDRMSAIQELEESRPQIVHLIEELVRQIPDGVYFDSLIQKDNKITLTGFAQSDARVSSLMTILEESEWITKPKIYKIEEDKKDSKRSMSAFKLEIMQTSPQEKKSNAKKETSP